MNCERIFRLIVVGKMRDRHLAEKCDEFILWLAKYGRCTVTVLPDSDMQRESAAICKELDKERNSKIFVLSEEGKTFSTVKFAGEISLLESKAVFVIGGPFGMSAEVKKRADILWSLSPLTFTHEMARVILAEQLYRAMNYLNGGSYHHQ